MRTRLTILWVFWFGLTQAQNYSDTIRNMRFALKTNQQVWLDKAIEYEEQAAQKDLVCLDFDTQIEKLTLGAETEDSKQKMKVLKQIMTCHQEKQKIQSEYFLLRVSACRYYEKTLRYWIDRSPKLMNEEALAETLKNAERCVKKTESRLNSALRDEKDSPANALDGRRKALQSYYQGISDLVYALRLANGLIVPQPETQLADTLHEIVAIKPQELIATHSQMEAESEVQKPDLVFKVQVAASQVELSAARLNGIYRLQENESFNMEIEGPWFKYALGEFSSYEEANAYKNRIAVAGAFVIVYYNNRKTSLPELSATHYGGEGVAKLNYRIQLLATKEAPSPEKVRALNLGDQLISIVHADSWYKYTVGSYESEAEAREAKAKLGYKDAFVVAYDALGQEVAQLK